MFHLLVEPNHLPVDGVGGSDCSLWRIFQSDGSTEERNNPIPSHLIYGTLIIMNLVDENLVHLIHNGVCFFGVDLLRKRREPLHVTEHHCDLLSLALYLVTLREDLLGETLGQVALDLGEFFVE